jgi:hypothetical protein
MGGGVLLSWLWQPAGVDRQQPVVDGTAHYLLASLVYLKSRDFSHPRIGLDVLNHLPSGCFESTVSC